VTGLYSLTTIGGAFILTVLSWVVFGSVNRLEANGHARSTSFCAPLAAPAAA
jgi:hypothetical protein